MKASLKANPRTEFASAEKSLQTIRKDGRFLLLKLSITLVVLAVIPFTIAGDNFTRGVAQLAFIYIALAVSFQILFGRARLISFGHAAMFGLGAYVSTMLIVRAEVPMFLAWVIAIVVTMIVAAIIGSVILRLGHLFLAVVTLALGEAAVLLASQLPITGGEEGMSVPAFLPGFGQQSLTDYTLAAVLVFIVIAIAIALPSTRYGREIRAVGDDPVAAESNGIPVRRRRVEVFVLASAIAAAAGIVYAHTARFIAPTAFGLDVSILVLAMVAVGGIKSTWGAIAGAILLSLLPEFAADLAKYNVLIYGAVLLIIFRFAPDGLAGITKSLIEFIQRKRMQSKTIKTEGTE